MTSTQIHYAGQAGWNDCPLVTSKKNVKVGGQKITARPPVVPMASTLPPPPPSRSASASSTSSLTPPPSSTPSLTPPPPTKVAALSAVQPDTVSAPTAGQAAEAQRTAHTGNTGGASGPGPVPADMAPTVDEVKNQLTTVLGLDTTLPSRELNHYKSRLESAITTLEPVHLHVVQRALSTRDRELLVEHSLVHSGVSTWVLPLRRILESIKH